MRRLNSNKCQFHHCQTGRMKVELNDETEDSYVQFQMDCAVSLEAILDNVFSFTQLV